jgi:N-acetylneuraminic acid mutarotase
MNIRHLVALTITCVLAACGGGGGGGSSTSAAAPQLSALAITPTSAYSGSHPGTLSFSGSVTVGTANADGILVTLVNSAGATVGQLVGAIGGGSGRGVLNLSGTLDISALPAGQYEIDVQVTGTAGGTSNVAKQAFKLIAYPWQSLAAMPRAVSEYAIAAVGTKVYVLGGVSTQDGVTTPVADVQVYDTTTGAWSSGPSVPAARAGASASVVGSRIYLVGGYDAADPAGLAVVDVLDIQAGSWSSGPATPSARFYACSVAIGSSIYVVDGTQAATDSPANATLERLDTTTGSWVSLASAGYVAAHPACAVANGLLYVTGGDTSSAGFSETIASQSYDPATNLWATTDFYWTNRSRHASVAVAGDVFIMGGRSDVGGIEAPTATTQAFTPASNTWSARADMPVAAQDIGAVAIGGTAYVFTPQASYLYDAQSDLP